MAGFSGWLIAFLVIACLIIIITLISGVAFIFIDRKRAKILKENYPTPSEL